ncbi:hypothetical protein [Clostridioides sp. ES-S-0001-03]|uniref:hypothetical protein n=1 Tax=Clostridioides sp. ES-S-0001-03 TaxID=2770771 RepID=UPI001D0C6D7A|nr:hypothetical protein [Clostridioides sp. ES-S-0001-03]
MNKNSDGWKLKAVIQIDEAIKIAQNDVKESNKYLDEIKNCKKIKVEIIGKNGTKIPVNFSNEGMRNLLKEGLEISLKSMQESALEIEKSLLELKKEGEKSEQPYTMRFL